MFYQTLLVFFTSLPIIVLGCMKPAFMRELVLDIRLGRILHYFVLFIVGIVLKNNTISLIFKTEPVVWIEAGLYFIVLVYAAVFAIASNNIEDIEIDQLTNTNRPLVKNAVDPKLYDRTSKISLLFSLVFSFLIGIEFFLAILGISLIYYIYSCKPFKLKRFVFLAKFLIGINSLISAVCGFYVAGGDLSQFPIFWLLFILIPVSLMANFVDLKDTAGDKAAGIKTLPVLLGETNAKRLIALFTISAYVWVFFYFNTLWIALLLIVTCSVHVFLLFRKPYQEKPLFLLHNSLFIGLIVLVLTNAYFQD